MSNRNFKNEKLENQTLGIKQKQKGTMILNNQEQAVNTARASDDGVPVQLTKEEMRAKIRASLAAKNAVESQSETPRTSARQQIPVYAARTRN